MQNFFYITGIVTWSIIGLAVTIFIGFFLVALVSNYIYPTLNNLFFAIFGSARLRRKGIVEDDLISLFKTKTKKQTHSLSPTFMEVPPSFGLHETSERIPKSYLRKNRQ